MGSTGSTRRKGSSDSKKQMKSSPLDRKDKERRSLRSFRKSEKVLTRPNSTLSLNRPITLANASEGELNSIRENLKQYSVDCTTSSTAASTTLKDAPLRLSRRSIHEASPKLLNRRATSLDRDNQVLSTPRRVNVKPNNHLQTTTTSNSSNSGSSPSPYTIINRDEIFDTNDDYKSIKDFLNKHYSTDGSTPTSCRSDSLPRGMRFSTENPLTPRSIRLHPTQSSCETDCNRAFFKAKEELAELTQVESRLKGLMAQEVPSSHSPTGYKVTFTLNNGTNDQESYSVSLMKAHSLIHERKLYLEKKMVLESGHCSTIRDLLTGSNDLMTSQNSSLRNNQQSLNGQSAFPVNGLISITPNYPIHSTPPKADQSLPYMRPSLVHSMSTPVSSHPGPGVGRKLRALSLIESADGNIGFDSSSYRNLMQDMKDVKTLLFRLQGLLQVAESKELTRSFSDNMTAEFGNIIQENDHLKHQLMIIQKEAEDKSYNLNRMQEDMDELRQRVHLTSSQSDETSTGQEENGSPRIMCDACLEVNLTNLNTSCVRCEDMSFLYESEC